MCICKTFAAIMCIFFFTVVSHCSALEVLVFFFTENKSV